MGYHRLRFAGQGLTQPTLAKAVHPGHPHQESAGVMSKRALPSPSGQITPRFPAALSSGSDVILRCHVVSVAIGHTHGNVNRMVSVARYHDILCCSA
jgi:hypothetical protein